MVEYYRLLFRYQGKLCGALFLIRSIYCVQGMDNFDENIVGYSLLNAEYIAL